MAVFSPSLLFALAVISNHVFVACEAGGLGSELIKSKNVSFEVSRSYQLIFAEKNGGCLVDIKGSAPVIKGQKQTTTRMFEEFKKCT